MKQNHRNIAIVSGKGGSGKTLITTTLALGLARAGRKTLLVDADMGTGGLTYYLGFTAFDRTSGGVSEYIKTGELPRPAEPRKSHPLSKELSDNMKFIPAGGYRNIPNIDITEDSINGIIDAFDKLFDFIIFDCRGGIDDESISVCKSVDDIVIVAETDASSIQASAYLVESLENIGISHKISGYLLNKVMDNPTQLIHVGRSFFRSECLGAIPLDIKTTRNFIQGEIPDVSSLFARHVFSIIPKLGINVDKYKSINVFSPNEYNYTSTKDPSLTIGGIVSVLILLYFGIILSFTSIMDTYLDIIGIEGDINRDRFAIASIIIAAIFLSADVVKIFLGKVFVTYMKLFRAIIGSQK